MTNLYRILVVDDDSDVLLFIQTALSTKYEVITATEGQEALLKFKECEPDLVLLDVMMPGLSGYEICQEIRKIPGKENVPVIMLSALDSIEDHKSGYREGASFYLTKPIPPDRLLRNVEVQLSTVGPPSIKKLTMNQIKDKKVWVQQKPKTIGPMKEVPQAVSQRTPQVPLRPRILVVDDDLDILRTLELMFQMDYEFLKASDGIEALRKVTAYEPDLLILDVMIPKVNGFQVCNAVRKLERFTDLPIIFLTGKDDPNTRQMGQKFNAVYMTKPMEPKELSEKVRELVFQYPNLNMQKRLTIEEIHITEMNPDSSGRGKWVD